MRCVAARLPRELRGRHSVLHRDLFKFQLAEPRDRRVRVLLVVEEITDALLVRAQERVDLRDALDMDAGCPGERQRGKPARVADGEFGGDPAAEREADERRSEERRGGKGGGRTEARWG